VIWPSKLAQHKRRCLSNTIDEITKDKLDRGRVRSRDVIIGLAMPSFTREFPAEIQYLLVLRSAMKQYKMN